MSKLIVVLGATACGKSGLGIDLAKEFGGEIVSADSRQVYTGLDLGTGKVTAQEMEGVPHYMLDVVAPNEPYSVVDFQQGAYQAIDGIVARGKVPFLVGGTGLYVRAVTQGFTFQASAPDLALRAALEEKSAEELYALVQAETGVILNESDRCNKRRLVRALEKARGGDSLTESVSQPRYEVLSLGVTFPRERLCQRIDQRLLLRLEAGMVEEVVALRAAGATDAFLEGLGLEYRFILHYLKGELKSREALVDELGRAIKRFAKRQMVWFRRESGVLWLDMEADPLAQARQAVTAFLEE